MHFILNKYCVHVRILREGKGKVHSRTGHEGPEGEERNSPALSLTSALDGVRGQSHAPANLPPEKRASTHCLEEGVGPRAGLDGCEKFGPPPPGFDLRTVQLVALQ